MGTHIDHLRGQPRLLQDGDRPQRRLHARPVTVKGQVNLLRIPFQQVGMSGGKGGSQRSHRIVKSRLVQGDHIHVPLAEQDMRSPGYPGKI